MITRLFLFILIELVVGVHQRNVTNNRESLKETLNPDGSPVDDSNQSSSHKHYHPDGASEIPLIIPENIKNFNSKDIIDSQTVFHDTSKDNQTIVKNVTNDKETTMIKSNTTKLENSKQTISERFNLTEIPTFEEYIHENRSKSDIINNDQLSISESLMPNQTFPITNQNISESINKISDLNLNHLKPNSQILSNVKSNILENIGTLNDIINSEKLNQPHEYNEQINNNITKSNTNSSELLENIQKLGLLPNSSRNGRIIDPKTLSSDDIKVILNYIKTNGWPPDSSSTPNENPTDQFKSVSDFRLVEGSSNLNTVIAPASTSSSSSSLNNSNGETITSESRENIDPNNNMGEYLKQLEILHNKVNKGISPVTVGTQPKIPPAIQIQTSNNIVPKPSTSNLNLSSLKSENVVFPSTTNGMASSPTLSIVPPLTGLQPQPSLSGSTKPMLSGIIPLRQGEAAAQLSATAQQTPSATGSLLSSSLGSPSVTTGTSANSVPSIGNLLTGTSQLPSDADALATLLNANPGSAAATLADTSNSVSQIGSVPATVVGTSSAVSQTANVPATATGSVIAIPAIPTAISDGSSNTNRDTVNSGTTDSAIPQISGVDVICGSEGMKVTVNFSQPFNGVIYSKDHYQDAGCIYVEPNKGQQSYTFEVGMITCGTLSGRGDDGTSYFQNTLVFQNDLEYIDSFDSSRTIRCDWKGSLNKPLTFRPVAVDILDVQTLIYNGDKIETKLEILLGSGPFGAPVGPQVINIGDPLSLVISIKSANDVNAIIHDCYAYDSPKSTRVPILLIDSNGCSTRRRLISSFTTTKIAGDFSSNLICFATFRAFKIPDALEVYFLCQLTVCRDNCVSPCSQSALGSQNLATPPPPPPPGTPSGSVTQPSATTMPSITLATTLAAATVGIATTGSPSAAATTISSATTAGTATSASSRASDGDAANNLAALISQTRSLGINILDANPIKNNPILPVNSNMKQATNTPFNFVGNSQVNSKPSDGKKSIIFPESLGPSIPQINGLDFFNKQKLNLEKEPKSGNGNQPNSEVEVSQITSSPNGILSNNPVSDNDYNILKPTKKPQTLDVLANKIRQLYSPEQIQQMLIYLKTNQNSRKKRSEEFDQSNRTSVSLFKKIKVIAPSGFYHIESTKYNLKHDPNNICIPKSGFIFGVVFLLLLAFTTSLTTLFLCLRHHIYRRTVDFKQTL